MSNYALIDWIKRNKDTKSEAEIKADLLSKGWKKQEVLTALDVVYRSGDPEAKKTKGRKWCCISAVIVGILLAVVIGVGGYYFSRYIQEQVDELARQTERNKIVGGSEVWREEVATKEYNLTGRYTYTNDGPGTITKVEGTVALIPNIEGYQEVISEEIYPEDHEIITDEQGNKFAKSTIERDIATGEKYEFKIVYRVKAKAFKNHLGACEGEQIADYLEAEEYIESDNEKIKQKAVEITADLADDCQKAEAIYNYVADDMEYVKNTKEEKGGALEALEKGQGDCTYYADYYVALARAVGIPTRFLEGASYTPTKEDQEIAPTNKHNWTESYLPGTGWTPVDATWGDPERNRPGQFSQADGKHIIMTRGRNIEAIDGHNYLSTRYWYKNSQGKPNVSLDDEWTVELVE
ncbi:transglutaminase-like domain-containing protein [Patescibacteria group bacterium]|nr:transglutaminase-like domain-containing protein [Patescibacteria group bacterium]